MTSMQQTQGEEKPKFFLRFISGDYVGKEFPLYEGKELFIGRNPELDIVLYDDLVSRDHAKVVLNKGIVQVFDLGSTNGTYLYAERVTQARLQKDDRLIIGASIIQLVRAGTAVRKQEDEPRQDSLLGEGRKAVFKGHLADIPLGDMLQMLHINKKSGIVAVAKGEDKGAVFLQDGAVIYGMIKDLPLAPVKAVFRMLEWKDGMFEFGASKAGPFDRTIPIPTQSLLLEGIKHNDALQELRNQHPLDHQAVRLPRPLKPGLASLDKDRLNYLQLAHNAYEVVHYLDLAPTSDLEAYRILLDLLKAHYLEVVPDML